MRAALPFWRGHPANPIVDALGLPSGEVGIAEIDDRADLFEAGKGGKP
jgi:hypothetical protein